MSPRVFLDSIPKAGAHLAERALSEMGCSRGQGPLGSATLFGRRQWIKSVLRRPWFTADVALVGIEVATPVRISWLARRFDRVPDGKYLRGHVQFSELVAELLTERGFRLLHVVRDPRDVAVSHAHYMLARPRHPFHRFYQELGDWDSRLAFSITGGRVPGAGYLASMAERYRMMGGWLRYPAAALVRFEDLVGGSGGGTRSAQRAALERIAALLEIEEADLDAVADTIFGGSSTFRKGRIGGWRQSFSDRHHRLFEGAGGAWMDQWGYGESAGKRPASASDEGERSGRE